MATQQWHNYLMVT